MRKFLLFFTLLTSLTYIHAEEPDSPSESSIALGTEDQAPQPMTAVTLGAEKPKVRLQLEVNPAEIEPLGLKAQNLQTEIMTELIQSNVLIQDDAKNPLLLLRLKTIEANGTWATFIQLAFFEDAELTRNKTQVLAMTWSQASLLSSSKEDFSKEVGKTVASMVASFVKDYQKAYAVPQ